MSDDFRNELDYERDDHMEDNDEEDRDRRRLQNASPATRAHLYDFAVGIQGLLSRQSGATAVIESDVAEQIEAAPDAYSDQLQDFAKVCLFTFRGDAA